MKKLTRCQIENCNNKVLAKGICSTHYLRFWRYGRYTRMNKKYPKGHKYNYGDRYKGVSTRSMHLKRVGNLRDKVLKRDNFQCLICRMTDEEHMKKWNRHITLDHKDGHGRVEAQRYRQGRM